MKRYIISLIGVSAAVISLNSFAGDDYFFAITCLKNATPDVIHIAQQQVIIAPGPGSSQQSFPATVDQGMTVCAKYRSFGDIAHNFSVYNAASTGLLAEVQITYTDSSGPIPGSNHVNANGRVTYSVAGMNQYTFTINSQSPIPQ